MTTNEEKNNPEQKPEDNLLNQQDKPSSTDKDNKPTKLDLQPIIVICNDSPLNRKDGKANDNIIILENEEKKTD